MAAGEGRAGERLVRLAGRCVLGGHVKDWKAGPTVACAPVQVPDHSAVDGHKVSPALGQQAGGGVLQVLAANCSGRCAADNAL